MQHVARDLDPVVDEDRLHLCDDRAGDLEVRASPVFRILCLARPLRRHTNAAGEPDVAVGDQ